MSDYLAYRVGRHLVFFAGDLILQAPRAAGNITLMGGTALPSPRAMARPPATT